MSRRQLYVLLIGGGVVVVCGVSALVGWIVEPESAVVVVSKRTGFELATHEFNWELAALVLTGLGTTGLALATAVLSTMTWQDVRASQLMATEMAKQGELLTEANELVRREQDERVRPTVIGAAAGGGNHTVNVELDNVGGGPAIRVEVAADYTRDSPDVRVKSSVLATLRPGDREKVVLSFSGDPPPGGFDHDAFRVTGRYFDRRGNPAGEILDWKHEPIEPSV